MTLLFFGILFNTISFAQYPGVNVQQNIQNKTIKDTLHGYEIRVPDWLEVQDFSNPHVWGGLLPEYNGIQNAILIKSYPKSAFKGIQGFANYIIEDVELGENPEWSKSHVLLAKDSLADYRNTDYVYHVELVQDLKVYYCDYMLLETSRSFLWVDFTGTKETYRKNRGKLKEFLLGLTLF